MKRTSRFAYLLSRGMAGLLASALLSAVPALAGEPIAADSIRAHGAALPDDDPSTPLELRIWLKVHDQAAWDARVQQLYTPGSPTYRKWLSDRDLKTYMPTPAEIAAARTEIESHGLTVRDVDPYGFSLRVGGTVAQFEEALQTHISRYQVKDRIARVTSSVPELGGIAAGLVAHVGGLNSLGATPQLKRPLSPATGKPFAGTLVTASGSPQGVEYASQCFYSPATYIQSGVNYEDTSTSVVAQETGLIYGAFWDNTVEGTIAPCGYSAAQVQGFYNMDQAYQRDYTGRGQTIVIIDAGTQALVQTDANTFNALEGLPALTAENYHVYNPFNATETGTFLYTADETDLDVEWAHAIAPGANLALVEVPSEDDEDFQAGILYAVSQNLGNVISLSYAESEIYVGDLDMSIYNIVAEMAASKGISLQVASGDDGDGAGYGIPPAVNGIGSSPYDTAVGGTTIATLPDSVVTIGWGNNLHELVLGLDPVQILDPPGTASFDGGSGGGSSQYFAKPSYQSSLPGAHRLMPDVSALADPHTGVEFVYNQHGYEVLETAGGTSLAAPIFSAMWAIADQINGASLGQAAPCLATLPSRVLKDVVPYTGPKNVTLSETEDGATTYYTAAELVSPLDTTTEFMSALWYAGNTYAIVSFGTDSSLKTAVGWDNVTGWGTLDFAGLSSLKQ